MSSQSNKSSLRQFLPEQILTSLKAAHSTSTFSVVISRRSQGWMKTDRWAIQPQAGVGNSLHFWSLFRIFSLSLYEKNGYFVRIHWQSLYKAALLTVVFVPFGLETSDRTSDRSKPAKCSSPRRGRNNFFPFYFLFGHIINILLTELGRSVWENLDLDRWYRPHCVRSVLATSVTILPYRPPSRLIRTKYCLILKIILPCATYALILRGSWGSTYVPLRSFKITHPAIRR